MINDVISLLAHRKSKMASCGIFIQITESQVNGSIETKDLMGYDGRTYELVIKTCEGNSMYTPECHIDVPGTRK